jgi:hypothetical protein
MFNDVPHQRVARDKKRTMYISRNSSAVNQRVVTDLMTCPAVESASANFGRNYDRFILLLLPVTETTPVNTDYQLTRYDGTYSLMTFKSRPKTGVGPPIALFKGGQSSLRQHPHFAPETTGSAKISHIFGIFVQ